MVLQGDVGTRPAVEHLCDSALQQFGSVGIWINNAGIDNGGASVPDLAFRRLDQVVDGNLKEVIYTTDVLFLVMK